MRQRNRLVLVLLLISVLYSYYVLFYNHETSTVQGTSVSTLTYLLSASVPTNSETRSRISNVRADKTNIQLRVNIKSRQKIARNSNQRIRSKVKVRPDVIGRWMNQKRLRNSKLEKRAKKKSSKAYAPGALERRTAGTGSGELRSLRSLPHVPVTAKTKPHPTQFQEQSNKVHAQSESRNTRVQFRNTSVGYRNGDVGVRTTQASTSSARVIIVAHGRSGSSFFGGIFNAHPDIFYIYEPLNKLHTIINQNDDDYLYSAEHVIKYILECNFDDDELLQMFSSKGFHRASSRPLVSPPFCNTTYDRAINFIGNQNWTSCNRNISADLLSKSCRKHKNIAAKVLLGKLQPAGLSWILDITSPALTAHSPEIPREEVDPVYVLYLVRDPRAVLYSQYRLGWVVPRVRHEHGLENGEADIAVKKVCDVIEQNLGTVLLHPRRVKLVRYEELVSDPEDMIKRLFGELRISPSKEVFSWIHSKTHGSVKMNAFSLSRNATVSINSWRENIPDQLLKIVERCCERVMYYLGYLPTHGSPELLRDLRKHLYLDKRRDLKKIYQWPAM